MKYDIAALIRMQRTVRVKSFMLRDIEPPAMFATDLYQASYAPLVALWTRTAGKIADEYARSLASITTDAPADLQGVLDFAADERRQLVLSLSGALDRWLTRVEAWQRGRFAAAVLAATQVQIDTLIGPDDARQTIGQFREWNLSLIRDVSNQTRKRIGDAVFSGLTNRTPSREVAATIREATGMARRRAMNIAVDQTQKLSAALADERRRQAGIEQWMWLHSKKLHKRQSHVERDGKIYSDDNPPPTMPGQEPFCGCRQRAIITMD